MSKVSELITRFSQISTSSSVSHPSIVTDNSVTRQIMAIECSGDAEFALQLQKEEDLLANRRDAEARATAEFLKKEQEAIDRENALTRQFRRDESATRLWLMTEELNGLRLQLIHEQNSINSLEFLRDKEIITAADCSTQVKNHRIAMQGLNAQIESLTLPAPVPPPVPFSSSSSSSSSFHF